MTLITKKEEGQMTFRDFAGELMLRNAEATTIARLHSIGKWLIVVSSHVSDKVHGLGRDADLELAARKALIDFDSGLERLAADIAAARAAGDA